MEHIIREQNILAAYEILELFGEFVLAKVPTVEVQKECPLELREAIASIIFALGRCSDLPELMHLRNLLPPSMERSLLLALWNCALTAVSTAHEDLFHTDNRKALGECSIKWIKAEVMKAIAQEYNFEWDSSNTEAEFSKKFEDLL
ncbi:hypothetical protein ACJX0J_025513, partial [Zea mays]